MRLRRAGNFGVVETSTGASYTFNLNASRSAGGWSPSSYMLRGGYGNGIDHINFGGVDIIPYGEDNDLPGYVRRLLSKFYAGEGIMGKKVGLLWGDGPKLYREATTEDGTRFYRAWTVGENAILAELRGMDFEQVMMRCLVDLMHLEGFWVKFIRNRAPRTGGDPRIVRIEHIPASQARLVYPGNDDSLPSKVAVARWPNPDNKGIKVYPLFDPRNPLKHPVSIGYFGLYTFDREHYSYPRYSGAFDWLELAGTLASVLTCYNENASAISLHIESPEAYWEDARDRIKAACEKAGEPYSDRLLDEYKDEAMKMFAETITGKENVGKYMHTSHMYNQVAGQFEGWKVTPIDKKIKDYIEAQISICRQSEAAATSGLGLDPNLANLIIDGKLSSGSEKLYSHKIHMATETAIPDRVLCRPVQIVLEANHPGTDLHVGLYRNAVEAEQNVAPQNRLKNNA